MRKMLLVYNKMICVICTEFNTKCEICPLHLFGETNTTGRDIRNALWLCDRSDGGVWGSADHIHIYIYIYAASGSNLCHVLEKTVCHYILWHWFAWRFLSTKTNKSCLRCGCLFVLTKHLQMTLFLWIDSSVNIYHWCEVLFTLSVFDKYYNWTAYLYQMTKL